VKFKASLDSEAILVTTILFIVFLGASALVLFVIWNKTPGFRVLTIIVVLAFIAALLNTRIRQYRIEGGSVKILRLFNSISIRMDLIEDMKIIDGSLLAGSRRRFGISGFFGYTGTFWNENFGTMRWLMTRRDKVICLRLKNNEIFFLSPDHTDQFFSALHAEKM